MKSFKAVARIPEVWNIKIDTISVLLNLVARPEMFPLDEFNRKYHKRFPAVTIKHKLERVSANIFPQSIVVMGLKCADQLDLFMKYIPH